MVRLVVLAAATLAALCGPPPLRADPLPPDPGQLEHLSDPPGVPAVPTPDSPPQLPIRYRTYVHRQVNVASDGTNIPGDAANEPSIAVDPTDPTRIAIGWRQFDNVGSDFRQAGWGYSTDGGNTWTFPGVIEPGHFRSDPVLSSDADGNFFYNSLTNEGGYHCHVFKSVDGGATWDSGVFAWGGDKQWQIIDQTTGILLDIKLSRFIAQVFTHFLTHSHHFLQQLLLITRLTKNRTANSIKFLLYQRASGDKSSSN